MKRRRQIERQTLQRIVFFGLILALLLSSVTSMCAALATGSDIQLDEETGALQEAGSNDPMTMDDFSLMMAGMRAIDPGVAKLTATPTLDSLTLTQIQALAGGSMPDRNNGGEIKLTIGATTDKNNQFKRYEIFYSDVNGSAETLAEGTGKKGTASLQACSFTLDRTNARYNSDGLFQIMAGKEVGVRLTDAQNEITDVSTRLTADERLIELIDQGLVAGWSDLYFYRAASVTAKVDPEMTSVTEAGSSAMLAAEGVTADCVYQWQRVSLNADGSIPDVGWENMDGAQERESPVTVDMENIQYAYRCVAFPNEAARTSFLAGSDTLCTFSNSVTLMAENKRQLVMEAIANGSSEWSDIQFVLSDVGLSVNVHERSQSYPGVLQDKYTGRDTAISPDEMWATLNVDIGGAETYTWQHSADNGTTWETIDVTTEPAYSIHMDAGTDKYIYRCAVTKDGQTAQSQTATFEALKGSAWLEKSVGGYVPATGNTAAEYNAEGDYYDSHNNRSQYAFAPAQNPNVAQYVSDGSLPRLNKWVPEEEGKEGNSNAGREYTIHLEADFTDVKEPDPIVYQITSDMDYATSNLTYARNWDSSIFNIGTGTEIKAALVRFADYVTSDGSGSFVGFSYTGHNNLPGKNYLYSSPFFTNDNKTAVDGFGTLHTYGVCGNGHWDSGFNQLATNFATINRGSVETFMFGNDANRLESIQRVGISIAGSNEHGYSGGKKSIADLYGKGYTAGQDSWYGILTTDGTGQHWLKNSEGDMTELYTNKTTEDAIYNALMEIHRQRYNPHVSEVTITDIVRAEFEVVAPAGAQIAISNGTKTVTWTDAEGDEYTAVCKVDGDGEKDGETTVTIRRIKPVYFTRNRKIEKTISIRACDDYIGSNDVHTNRDPATITYTNQVGDEKTSASEDSPTVNVPIRVMSSATLSNWLLKGDATDLDALAEDFLEAVEAYVYKYEQINGSLQLQWKLGDEMIAESEMVELDPEAHTFPKTDTTGNAMANVTSVTDFTGLIRFDPSEASNGKVGVSVIPEGAPFAQTTLSVIPVCPVFSQSADAVWLGEALNTHNAAAWAQSTPQRFGISVPDKSQIPGVTDEAHIRMQARVKDDEYLNRLTFTLCDANWQSCDEGPLNGDTIVADLSEHGGKQMYKLAVSALLNEQEIQLYSSTSEENSGYPVYTVYQAKPVFKVYSYTTGLKTETVAIPILRTGDAGLADAVKPTQAPDWAAEAPEMWQMLENSFDAYRGAMRFDFISTEEEALYSDETLAAANGNLLLTAKHEHGAERPIVTNIGVALSEGTEAFITLKPNLYVAACKLKVYKSFSYAAEAGEPDADWRFPILVTGGNLPDAGLQLILAGNEAATLVDLSEGNYHAAEDTQWSNGWTASTGSGDCELKLRLTAEDGQIVQEAVYRSDNEMAVVDSQDREGTISIVNTYAPGQDKTYLEDEVTNVYRNGKWSEQ